MNVVAAADTNVAKLSPIFTCLAALALIAIAGMMIYDQVQAHSAMRIVAELRVLERGCRENQLRLNPRPVQRDYCGELKAYVTEMGISSGLISN